MQSTVALLLVTLAAASNCQWAPSFTVSQYHAQDERGQASFGYSHPGQAASNFRDAWGNQVGSWAYIDPEGKEVRVSYVADSNGFRVLSNSLPVAPQPLASSQLVGPSPVTETAEVQEAKRAHFAAVAEAKARNAAAVLSRSRRSPHRYYSTKSRPAVHHQKAAHYYKKAAVPVAPPKAVAPPVQQVQVFPVAHHAFPAFHQVQAVPVAHHALPAFHQVQVVPHAVQAAPEIQVVQHAVPAAHEVQAVPVAHHAFPAFHQFQPVPAFHQVQVAHHAVPATPEVQAVPVAPEVQVVPAFHQVQVAHHAVPATPEVQVVPAFHQVQIAHHAIPAAAPEVQEVQHAVPAVPAIVPSTIISKYHSQDELGQASFGHVTPDQSASNFRDANGNQMGHYAYINPDGQQIVVYYTAGVGGFRVLSNALPEAPSAPAGVAAFQQQGPAVVQDTVEVADARRAHLALFEEARNRIKTKTSH